MRTVTVLLCLAGAVSALVIPQDWVLNRRNLEDPVETYRVHVARTGGHGPNQGPSSVMVSPLSEKGTEEQLKDLQLLNQFMKSQLLKKYEGFINYTLWLHVRHDRIWKDISEIMKEIMKEYPQKVLEPALLKKIQKDLKKMQEDISEIGKEIEKEYPQRVQKMNEHLKKMNEQIEKEYPQKVQKMNERLENLKKIQKDLEKMNEQIEKEYPQKVEDFEWMQRICNPKSSLLKNIREASSLLKKIQKEFKDLEQLNQFMMSQL